MLSMSDHAADLKGHIRADLDDDAVRQDRSPGFARWQLLADETERPVRGRRCKRLGDVPNGRGMNGV